MTKILAKQGELVTCVNGHPICDVAIDIHSGDTMRTSQFKNWRIDPPKSGDVVIRCPECDGKFITRNELGIYPYINGKWRGDIWDNYAA